MASFTDAKDREWRILIDVPTVKRLREHDLDVLEMFDDGFKVFEKIVGDPVRLVDTLWVICKAQIDERGLDEEGFCEGLFGDALMLATNALVEGVCDFFPDPKRREAIQAVFRKVRETESALLESAAKEIEAVDTGMILEAVQTVSTTKSSESPGS